MPKRKLMKIAATEVEKYSVIAPAKHALPVLKGTPPTTDKWPCPKCKAVLIDGLDDSKLSDLINTAIQCPECSTVSTWQLRQ